MTEKELSHAISEGYMDNNVHKFYAEALALIPDRVRVCPKVSKLAWKLYVQSAKSVDAPNWTRESLLELGYAEECPGCGAISAYAWSEVNYCPLADVDEGLPESERVYHIGIASGFEWQCGKCGTSWTPEDSPLNSPCYTHSEE